MSKLSNFLYDVLYRRPLAHFFNDFWKEETASETLMNELRERMRQNPKVEASFLRFVLSDQQMKKQILDVLKSEDLLTGNYIQWMREDLGVRSDFLDHLNVDEKLGGQVLEGLLDRGVHKGRFNGWLKGNSAIVKAVTDYLVLDNDFRKEFIAAIGEKKIVDREDFVRWINHNPENLEWYIRYLKDSPTTKTQFNRTLLQLRIPEDLYLPWVQEHDGRIRKLLLVLLENEEMKSVIFDIVQRNQSFQDQFLEWLIADEGRFRTFTHKVVGDSSLARKLEEEFFHRGSLQDTFLKWLAEEERRQTGFGSVLQEFYPEISKRILESLMQSRNPMLHFFSWLNTGEENQNRLLGELKNRPKMQEKILEIFQNDQEMHQELTQILWQEPEIVDEFLDHISNDDAKRKDFLQQLNARESYRSTLNIMHEKELTSHLTYVLPTVTSSFPRSGSNFFQSVLRGSSGLQCISLYHPNYPQEQVYNLKSHALTPEALAREFKDMVPYELTYPAKIVYIKRDPRDVLISLYEFACFNHHQDFSMDEFLGMNYYYIANPPGKRDIKTIFYLPGPEACTVAEAFQLFTGAHFKAQLHPLAVDTLALSYEGMVEDPEPTFRKAFDFLNLDCPLNQEFIQLKVSQYSDSKRKRGIAYGWKQSATLSVYQPLIDQITALLKDEIEFLGYNQQS